MPDGPDAEYPQRGAALHVSSGRNLFIVDTTICHPTNKTSNRSLRICEQEIRMRETIMRLFGSSRARTPTSRARLPLGRPSASGPAAGCLTRDPAGAHDTHLLMSILTCGASRSATQGPALLSPAVSDRRSAIRLTVPVSELRRMKRCSSPVGMTLRGSVVRFKKTRNGDARPSPPFVERPLDGDEVRSDVLGNNRRNDLKCSGGHRGRPRAQADRALIFGNAKGGTPPMQAIQTIGIDLPLKVLVWQDAAGHTWLSYNDPGWLARRYGLGHEVQGTVSAMAAALSAVARAATTSS
jgi:hypothetical protein